MKKNAKKAEDVEVLEVVVHLLGKELKFDLDTVFATDDVPRSITIFSLHLAEAIHQQRHVEAEYRAAKSKFAAGMLTRDSKLPEWKIRNRWEREEDYQTHQVGIALAERTVNRLAAIIEGLKAKAQIAG